MKSSLLKSSLFMALGVSLTFISCSNDDQQATPDLSNNIFNEVEKQALLKSGLNAYTDNVQEVNASILGKEFNGYSFNDVIVGAEEIDRILQDNTNENEEIAPLDEEIAPLFVRGEGQRINTPAVGRRTIFVGILNVAGDPSRVSPQLRNATYSAIQAYNNLGLETVNIVGFDINTAEQFNNTQASNDAILVFFDAAGTFVPAGSTAGGVIASNGNPGNAIGFSAVLNNAGFGDILPSMIHELGHTFGVIHSDFMNSASCPNINGLDGFTFGDQVNVPFTDATGRLANSIMRRCVIVSNNGNTSNGPTTFTAEDNLGFRVIFARRDFF